jgi:endonuclease YncB( thermonuclease family)
VEERERVVALSLAIYQNGDQMLQVISAWPYVRDAELLNVIDGDTLRLRIDLGWRVYIDGEIRLLRINAPEMSTAAGRDARLFVINLFNEVGTNMLVSSRRRDPDRSFTRYLADVMLADGRDLSDTIIQAGHGVPYP